eukprot:scaffold515782_cov14-Prasinocladus_malaysianus.AAC.1
MACCAEPNTRTERPYSLPSYYAIISGLFNPHVSKVDVPYEAHDKWHAWQSSVRSSGKALYWQEADSSLLFRAFSLYLAH